MDRLAIVAKCIDIWKDVYGNTRLQFNKSIWDLKDHSIVIKIGKYVEYFSHKVGENTVILYDVKDPYLLKNSPCILYSQNTAFKIYQEYLDCINYTRELLWNELGTLENPTLEEVNYYIELLSKEW